MAKAGCELAYASGIVMTFVVLDVVDDVLRVYCCVIVCHHRACVGLRQPTHVVENEHALGEALIADRRGAGNKGGACTGSMTAKPGI